MGNAHGSGKHSSGRNTGKYVGNMIGDAKQVCEYFI